MTSTNFPTVVQEEDKSLLDRTYDVLSNTAAAVSDTTQDAAASVGLTNPTTATPSTSASTSTSYPEYVPPQSVAPSNTVNYTNVPSGGAVSSSPGAVGSTPSMGPSSVTTTTTSTSATGGSINP